MPPPTCKPVGFQSFKVIVFSRWKMIPYYDNRIFHDTADIRSTTYFDVRKVIYLLFSILVNFNTCIDAIFHSATSCLNQPLID